MTLQSNFDFRQDVQHDFDGATYEPKRDKVRLNRQLDKVRELMRGGYWSTLEYLAEKTGFPEASISARIRDLRKPRFGGYTVERKSLGNGLFAYRIRL